MKYGDTQAAVALAHDLHNGGEAIIVGNQPLLGVAPEIMWFDGLQVIFSQARKENPGVRVRMPGGTVHLYVCTTMDNAERLLQRAREIVGRHTDD